MKTPRTDQECEQLTTHLLYLDDFRKYLSKANTSTRIEIGRLLTYRQCWKSEVLFQKGDPSDMFYIILKGSLDMYNVDNYGHRQLVGNVGKGRQIGERGCIRQLPRSLTAIAADNCILIQLDQPNFKRLLGDSVFEEMEQKLRFIENYFPLVKKYTHAQKERIAYSMILQTHKRGQVVLNKGVYSDCLYFVMEGEVVVLHFMEEMQNFRTKVVGVGVGNCFGEEGVLFGRKTNFTVQVSSEYVIILQLKRCDMIRVIPDETVSVWKHNYLLKEKGRNSLRRSAETRIRTSTPIQRIKETDAFPMASSYAKKRLKEITSRQDPERSQKSTPALKSYKIMVDMMKDFKVEKLLKTLKPRQTFIIAKKQESILQDLTINIKSRRSSQAIKKSKRRQCNVQIVFTTFTTELKKKRCKKFQCM